MNWIPLSLLSDIAEETNVYYSRKRISIPDVDISEDLLSVELVRIIRQVLLTPRAERDESKEGNGFNLSVQAYKATGALERKHGDIAVVVSDIDRRVVGTGFYEAKLQSLDGHYPAFNVRQIQKLESNTPRLAILMHEREESPVSDNPYDRGFPGSDQYRYYEKRSLCTVLAASWARKFRHLHDATRQKRPYSFGHHFVTRYLLGADLDYSRPPAKAIARWIRKTKRAKPVIIDIRISKSGEGLLQYEPVLIPPGSPPLVLEALNKNEKLAEHEFIPII